MTKHKDIKQKLLHLEHALDVFGPEMKRWRKRERAALEGFVQSHPKARQLLQEAKALAEVMDAAPDHAASDALKARIVAAAVNDSRREARVVPIAASVHRTGHGRRAWPIAAMWPAGALAASFAFGLYLGVSGIGGQAFDNSLQIVALNGDAVDSDDTSWFDGGDGEDQL